MELQQALTLVDSALSDRIGRQLSEVEIALFNGAWEDATYEQIADRSGYSINYLQRDLGPKFWKQLSDAFARKLNKTNVRGVFSQLTTPIPSRDSSAVAPIVEVESIAAYIDRGEAIDVSIFYGRTTELATLTDWIESDRCRLIALLGMGGIGKSSLAAKLIDRLQDRFDRVIWRSLRNAPPLETLLKDLVPFLSQQQDTEPTPARLLYWLRNSRCLVILDNAETIMQAGERTGYYQPGYEDYGDLLRLLGETNHQSCVLLTSREKPAEIDIFEALDGSVRSLALAGSPEASFALFASKGLTGSDAERVQLGERYGYSPLALKIVTASIHSLFNGEIRTFLAQDTLVFNGLRRLLDRQFDRLSELEKAIMYWLSIEREWTSIAQLQENIVPRIPRASLLESLESLSWRNLIEMRAGQYTQQPVVMEYTIDCLISQIAQELIAAEPTQFIHYALIKTNTKDYIRHSQISLILQPIATQFQEYFANPTTLKSQIQQILETIHKLDIKYGNYGAGNLLNLALHLGIDLSGFDFSHLSIRHADLQGKALHRVNLSGADFSNCTFTQTFGAIFAIAFSPDNRILAFGDSNCSIRLWQTVKNDRDLLDLDRPLLTLRGHQSWIFSVAWHPDGQKLISCSEDLTLKLWDIRTGQCLHTLVGHQKPIWSVVWSPDGQSLASSSSDCSIKIWNAQTGDCLHTWQEHQNLVWSVAWSPDGKTLASCSDDRSIRLWDVASGRCLKILQAQGYWVRSVAWSPDGKMLASTSSDRSIWLWDSETGECLRTLTGHQGWLYGLAWSPDGKTLASSSGDFTVKIWNPVNGDCLKTLQGHQEPIWTLAWAADGKILASGSYDQTVRLWNVETGQCRRILQGYTNCIGSVVWSPDGRSLASSSTDRTVRVWDAATGQCTRTLTGHQGWVYSVDWSPNRPIIASGSNDNTVKLWDVRTGTCSNTLRGHDSWVWCVAWSPSGQMLATGSSTNDLTVRLWHPETGACLKILSGHQSWIWWLQWHPNGKILATAGNDRSIRLWDVDAGTCLYVLNDDRESGIALAWSPDGKCLATSTIDFTVRLWQLETETWQDTAIVHSGLIWSIAWSPDGRSMATASDDGTIKISNVDNYECLHTLAGHQQRIWSIAWSPDGNTLASSSSDETIRLWDVKKGECSNILRIDRAYEGTNIAGVTGITEAQQATLKALGCVERAEH
jgi:WD40 repeat protein